MTPHDLGRLYFEKGRQDEDAATELADNADISDSIVGFHCQQAVEKYLKALLATQEVRVLKIHDLASLIEQLGELGVVLPDEYQEITELTPFSVLARYPLAAGEAEPLDRPKALSLVASVREWVERELG